ncbi:DNA-directed RNA polymerase sigma-70 factor [Actinocatenispora thailandica]|uniref:DNA-directed RNA polymerase sigma-70 factor n=1 Tax=Actinocatenispora thailandica TaxID=227318 RepID=A0A7R7DKI4_9ACTN|nr:SigE family RNA polymerase sigma factor [Actinocatenispora thailandica]BCJ33200.1 DNA-directed RNA polymerase sigma-70 factor [Actinocatenispora thailandica]
MRADREREYVAYVEASMVRLRRTAYHLSGNWHAAEDLVQETLAKLYQRWNRLREIEALDGYVRKMLYRTFLSHTKRAWYRRISLTEPPDAPAPDGRAPDDRLDLMAALARLPAGQRAVVTLRYLERLDVNETARVLGRSPGTVKSQTANALANLRTLLPGYRDEPRHAESKG